MPGWKKLFSGSGGRLTKPPAKPDPVKGSIVVDHDDAPFRLMLGKQELQFHPETALAAKGKQPAKDWLVIDPDRFFTKISGFARIRRGETILVGRENEEWVRIFDFPKSVAKRHLKISNKKGDLGIKTVDPDGETAIAALNDEGCLDKGRVKNLRRLRKIFGGPIELREPDDALKTLENVNGILRKEAYRPADWKGRPGGVLELPGDLTPIVVSDLHARVDNLLKVLSENNFLEGLATGSACLVFLGDAPHSELDGELEDMDSSVLIMDIILRLKEQFPENVFYIRGNHDSFSPDIGKGGVPQAVLFRKRLRELRGKAYERRMALFFERLPLIVKAPGFIACHGGPPRAEVGYEKLVNIRKHPDLLRDLVLGRMKRSSSPAGYTKGEVKKFRRSLGVDKETPLLVGHSPLSRLETVWLNAGEIENHHIVFSALPHCLAIFVGTETGMIPLIYPGEPLLELINSL